MAPPLTVAHVLFAALALWLVVRASLHALVGLADLMRGEDTLSQERLAVAALSGALLALAAATALGAGTLVVRLALAIQRPL